eukprot:452521-Heterocapsa_arctica.AAC.1
MCGYGWFIEVASGFCLDQQTWHDTTWHEVAWHGTACYALHVASPSPASVDNDASKAEQIRQHVDSNYSIW